MTPPRRVSLGACAALDGASTIIRRPPTGSSRPTSSDDDQEFHPARWVVDRLGINSRTLRDWHRRYGLTPTGHTAGGHRRYSGPDVERLAFMCRLIDGGVPVGKAAALSHRGSTARPGDPPVEVHGRPLPVGVLVTFARQVELLTRAASELDQHATNEIIVAAIGTYGVVSAWTDVLAPALRLRGEQFGRTADGINVEHLLSECTRTALSAVAWQPRHWLRTRPVLLAAPDGEHHVLPLHALAAALAEQNRPSVLLGASVPQQALTASVSQLQPVAIFLWSHAPDTVRRAEPTPPRTSHDPTPTLLVGGPGWPAHVAGRVDTLAEALHACTTHAPAGTEPAAARQ